MALSEKLQRTADYFISLSNETGELISNLKLQKLVYYAQTWHLALAGEPLFDEDCQAWVHGPVVPELYQEYRHLAWRPIERADLEPGAFERIESAFGQKTQEVLDSVCAKYFGKGAYELELMSHAETPWRRTRGNRAPDEICTETIDKELMKAWANHYAQIQPITADE